MEQNPDIGIGVIGTKTENPTDHLHRAMKNTIMDRQEAFLDLIFGRHYSWHVWGKVYRREILLATNQEIDSSVSLGEDLERNLYAFPRAKKSRMIPNTSTTMSSTKNGQDSPASKRSVGGGRNARSIGAITLFIFTTIHGIIYL